MRLLKKHAETNAPKRCLANARKEVTSTSASGHARNYDQANYARRSGKHLFQTLTNKSDDLMQAVYAAKKPGDNFIRSVQEHPEAIVVLATNNQINDIKRFCADPELGKAAIFSVDLTFNLGDFYVCVTSYKNPMLTNIIGNNPTQIGPCQIQHRKLHSSYQFLASVLKREEPKLINLKVFGSESERNIITAFKEEFPNSINLQCFRHFRANIESRLSSWKPVDREEVVGIVTFLMFFTYELM